MNVVGNSAGFRLEDLVALIRFQGLQGSLVLSKQERKALLVFHEGRVLLPLPLSGRGARSTARARREEARRLHRQLAELICEGDLDFEFLCDVLPRKFRPARSLAVAVESLCVALRRAHRPAPNWPDTKHGMRGTLTTPNLQQLLRRLGLGRYSGQLQIGAGALPQRLCFDEGLAYAHHLHCGSGSVVALPVAHVEATTFSWTWGKVASLLDYPRFYARVRWAQPVRAAAQPALALDAA